MAASFPLVASKYILHPRNLYANTCGGSWERLTLTTRLVMLSVCRDWDTGGGPQAEKGGTSDPPKSEDGEGRGGGEEPPIRPGWGTSDEEASKDRRPSGLRNLQSSRAEEPPTRPGWGTSGEEASKDRRPSGGSKPPTSWSLDRGHT